MISTSEIQPPQSSGSASETPISLKDTLSAAPIETYVPGSGLVFPPEPVGYDPELGALEQLWGVITFPLRSPHTDTFRVWLSLRDRFQYDDGASHRNRPDRQVARALEPLLRLPSLQS